jgi:hypothetical protein
MYFFCYACYSSNPKIRIHGEGKVPNSKFSEVITLSFRYRNQFFARIWTPNEEHKHMMGCYECNSTFAFHYYDHEIPSFQRLFPDLRPQLFDAGCLPPRLQVGKYKPTEDKPQNTTDGFHFFRLTILQETRARFQKIPPRKTFPAIYIPQIFPEDNPNRQPLFLMPNGILVEKTPGILKNWFQFLN